DRTGARLGRRLTDAAAAGDCGDRRDPGVDGAVAGDYAGGSLFPGGQESSYASAFFFLTARFRVGVLWGAGSFDACSATSLVANVLRPPSSKSITVWCSLTSTSVP